LRLRWLAFVSALTLLSGCIRMDFDLCDDDPPHPECADAGQDGGTDAGASSDSGSDAGADAGSDAGADAG